MADPLRVFIGSPGDMAPERAALMELEKYESSFRSPVRFKTWKTTAPGIGDPQRVIFGDDPIASFDIVVILVWKRLGVPSGYRHPVAGHEMTGTEAEFVLALQAHRATGGPKPQILLYRCTRKVETDPTIPVDPDHSAQLAAVQRFFASTETGKSDAVLPQTFDTAEALRLRFTSDLNIAIGRLQGAPPPVTDWPAAEELYRQHLIASQRIVKFHTAEARAPVEVELEKVFIKLMAQARSDSPLDTGTRREFEDAIAGHDLPFSLHHSERGAFLASLTPEELQIPHPHLSSAAGDGGLDWLPGPLRSEATPVSLPDLLRQHPHLALAGSPGSGKSTLLQFLVLTFASSRQEEKLSLPESRLPVLVRLRQFYRWIERQRHEKKCPILRPAHFAEFLEHAWREEKGAPELPGDFFPRLLAQPQALILLDGLDEVADPVHRREVAALVAAALDDWRHARVILTSRPRAWESEGRSALGSRVGEARICDLDDAQIQEFVRHWYLAATLSTRGDSPSARGHAESRAVDLIGAVQPERIRRLAATPLMLSILAMVHSRGVGLPQERSQLYHECIEFMLGYWDEIQGLEHDPELAEVARLDRQTKRQLLEPVAHWMHRLGSEQIEPLHDDLVAEFAHGFRGVLNEPEAAARRHARAFLRLIVERGGLMQESEAGQFRFVHLTFQEYLAASAIAHGESPFEQVKSHLHDPWWREVILLTGGEISRMRLWRVKMETTEWLTRILGAKSWAEEWLLRDLQLAAQCCAEMKETGVAADVTEDLARRLITAVMDERENKCVADLRFVIRAWPAGHLPRAIAAQLPATPCRGQQVHHSPPLVLAELLPSEVIAAPLREVLGASIPAGDRGVALTAAYLALLHSPAAGRSRAFAVMREVVNLRDWMIYPVWAEKLVALADETLTPLLLTWWREARLTAPVRRGLECAALLLRFGTEADRQAAGAQLANGCLSDDRDWRSAAYDAMGGLGSMADIPVINAALESTIADLTDPWVRSALPIWASAVAHRMESVDLTVVQSLAAAPAAYGHREAQRFLLRGGDEATRGAIRRQLQAELPATIPTEDIDLFKTLIEDDPEPDLKVVAARLNEIAAEKVSATVGGLIGLARRIGEMAWAAPDLVTYLVELSRIETWIGGEALAVAAALASARPADAAIELPSVASMAERAVHLAANPTIIMESRAAMMALVALSTLPELRGTVGE